MYALVVSMYKKGDTSVVNNCRLISLSSNPCKVLESIIKDIKISHLSINKLIDDRQNGFLLSHFTASQLLQCCYDWNKSADDGKPTDVVHIDFSKACGSISHDKFAHKLES